MKQITIDKGNLRYCVFPTSFGDPVKYTVSRSHRMGSWYTPGIYFDSFIKAERYLKAQMLKDKLNGFK